MRTQTLLDKPAATPLGPQLQRLEPCHVLLVEEHVADRDELLVDFVRVSRQDYAFRYDSVR